MFESAHKRLPADQPNVRCETLHCNVLLISLSVSDLRGAAQLGQPSRAMQHGKAETTRTNNRSDYRSKHTVYDSQKSFPWCAVITEPQDGLVNRVSSRATILFFL